MRSGEGTVSDARCRNLGHVVFYLIFIVIVVFDVVVVGVDLTERRRRRGHRRCRRAEYVIDHVFQSASFYSKV